MQRATPEQIKQSNVVTIMGIVALVYLIVTRINPEYGFIQCPFHFITGYSCPGCGMTRATVEIVKGDLIASWQWHPFGIFFFVFATSFTLYHVYRAITKRVPNLPFEVVARRYSKPIWFGLFTGILVFGAVRLILELTGILTPI